jgi:hypothetical protein
VYEGLCGLVGIDFVEADFHYVVFAHGDAGGFKVEEDDGLLQVE